MYSSSAVAFFFLIFFFIEIRHDLKVFPLEASEQSVVWVLIVFFFFFFFFFFFLYVHVTRGNIITVLVNIVFPSGCHRVLDFSNTMLIRWRCEGLPMSCCHRNTIGQHRVSFVVPSCSKI